MDLCGSPVLNELRKKEGDLDFHRRFEPAVYLVPVYDVPESLHELRPVVLIIQVVGMLPDIENHENGAARGNVDVMLLDLHGKEPFRRPGKGEGRPAGTLNRCGNLGELLPRP